MTIQTAMLSVSIFNVIGAWFLALVLYRYHRGNVIAQHIVCYPIATGLQAGNVAASFLWDASMVDIPTGILLRSTGGWLGIGLVTWYFGFYFAGKVNGRLPS